MQRVAFKPCPRPVVPFPYRIYRRSNETRLTETSVAHLVQINMALTKQSENCLYGHLYIPVKYISFKENEKKGLEQTQITLKAGVIFWHGGGYGASNIFLKIIPGAMVKQRVTF
jgi:hypothetical protein